MSDLCEVSTSGYRSRRRGQGAATCRIVFLLRSYKLRSQSYPLRLRVISDLAALRRDITRAAAATGRSPNATGLGNPTKRLRLVFTEPQRLKLRKIAALLARSRGVSDTRSKEFAFQARPPTPGGAKRVHAGRWKGQTSHTSTTRRSYRFTISWSRRTGPIR
jgi:hypothetical protein